MLLFISSMTNKKVCNKFKLIKANIYENQETNKQKKL